MAQHLAETMAYIYRCLQGRERDKYNALMAIGLISVAAGREIKPYLQNILITLRFVLLCTVVMLTNYFIWCYLFSKRQVDKFLVPETTGT